MTWFKVDDGFATHPKAITLPDNAVAIWTRAGSWCSANLTDGHFPKAMLGVLRGKPAAAAALVAAGLWTVDPDGNGWWYHDWHDYQPTREKKLAERAAAAERQRRAREAAKARRDAEGSNEGSHAVTAPVTDAVTHNSSNAVTAPVSHGPPDPTRPVVVVKRSSKSSSVTRKTDQNNDDLDQIRDILAGLRPRQTIDHDWAAKVQADILDNAPDPPRHPAAYVLAAIRKDPDRYLPTHTPPPYTPEPNPTGPPADDVTANAKAARQALAQGRYREAEATA